MVSIAALVLLVIAASSAAAAPPVFVTGSSRIDVNLLRRVPDGMVGIEDGAVNLEGWFDLRALAGSWEASARLRVQQASGVEDDPGREELDRRHLAFLSPRLEVLAGNHYTTFGNGLVLRSLEQRFVTLNRSQRAFNLDRNLDGARVRLDLDRVRMTALSGAPRRTVLDERSLGGAADADTDDLVQGTEVAVTPHPAVTAAFAFVRAELASPDRLWEGRETEELVSYRVAGDAGVITGQLEYAEIRPRAAIADALFFTRGVARYLRLEGGAGPVGISVEGKSYRGFEHFPYNQPPTLVRTHESVLLNRATHVLLPDDERGIQVEAVYTPEPFTSVIMNVATADDHAYSARRRFREVYLGARTEREDLGAARLDLGWSRDRVKFVENRWTGALELERFLPGGYAVIADLELQGVDSRFGDHTDGLVRLAVSRAERWTASLTAEHTTSRRGTRRDWLFASVDLRLSDRHDLTLGYGSRPAGLVCSGGFCFVSPEFDGAEFRLLSRF